MPTTRRSKTYWFNDVTISVFDIHTAIDAIAAGRSGFQDRFRYLIDAGKYHEQYSSASPIETKNLRILPLGRRVTGVRGDGKTPKVKSKFWHGYLRIEHDGTPDRWKQQLPFVVRPKTHVLALRPSIKGVVANVEAFAYLNTLGWSTNVRIRLQGRFKGDKLVEFMDAISARGTTPWMLKGSQTTLTGVFRFFQSHLSEEIYSPDRPPDPFRTFPRRWVIALNSYSGPIKSFDSMSDGEKHLFYSILNGSQIRPTREFPAPILIRESRPENFALIDFERGILVFPQSDADNVRQNNERKHPSRPLGCHAENTRAFYVMFETMRQFLMKCDQWQLHDGKFQELQSCVNATLKQLPQRCWNQIANYFQQNHTFPSLAPPDNTSVGSPVTEQPQDKVASMSKVTVFISFSHDSLDHEERVRGLGASLSRDGCECSIDFYKNTGEDWPAWMTRQLLETDFVLCVATENYERRFHDKELPDQGLGVGWEAGLIRRLLYAKKLQNDRIFPVVFAKSDRDHIPLELQGYDNFLLDGPAGYESLLRKLFKRPLYAPTEIGTPPVLATTQTAPLFGRPREATSSSASDLAGTSSTFKNDQSDSVGRKLQPAQDSDASSGRKTVGRPRVYISFTWREKSGVERALKLADRLRSAGIDARIDQYYLRGMHGFTPPPLLQSGEDAWTRWQEEQIRDADRVLIICGPEYANSPSDSGAGRDLQFMGEDLQRPGVELRKFVPVGFTNYVSNKPNIPQFLQGANYYDLSHGSKVGGLKDLIRHFENEFPLLAPASPDS